MCLIYINYGKALKYSHFYKTHGDGNDTERQKYMRAMEQTQGNALERKVWYLLSRKGR